jgi:hypothetical protein
VLPAALPNFVRFGVRTVFEGVAVCLAAAWIVAAYITVRRSQAAAVRVVFAFVAGGLAFSGVYLALNRDYTAGRAFLHYFPFLFLSVLVYPTYASGHLTARQARLVPGLLSAWLGLQVLIGAYVPFNPEAFVGSLHAVSSAKAEAYDLSPIQTYLQRNPPQQLLVSVPPQAGWILPLYTQFAVSEFPAHFQSGLVIDNTTTYQNYWPARLSTLPDYALVWKGADYIGPQQLGTRVLESPDLVLYNVTATDLTPFSTEEARLQGQEAGKPSFLPAAPEHAGLDD